jgi:ketosteroid isomerase-like protein
MSLKRDFGIGMNMSYLQALYNSPKTGKPVMRSLALAIPVLLFTATAHARDLKTEIDMANQKFGAAYDKGDAAAIARLYTPQATIFPPGADMATGRDDIQKVWAGAIQSGLKFTGLQTILVEQYGNAAREIGRFTAESPNAQKQMTKLVGKYVVIWKRLNGTWMLDSDIWNLNQ